MAAAWGSSCHLARLPPPPRRDLGWAREKDGDLFHVEDEELRLAEARFIESEAEDRVGAARGDS